MKNKFKGKIALFVGCGIAMFFAVSAIVMWLWNCLLPEIIGVKIITFWQAMGILVLSKILFGGFGGKGFHKDKFRRLKEERMSGMSPEEKERLKEIWKQRCDRGFFRDQC
ncbi:hypothetical protein [Kaistella sp.]|uniref:hypothetical protein n=1 Tax=Kaistella sp. TaxID=2782235 RepID=UPI003C3D2480